MVSAAGRRRCVRRPPPLHLMLPLLLLAAAAAAAAGRTSYAIGDLIVTGGSPGIDALAQWASMPPACAAAAVADFAQRLALRQWDARTAMRDGSAGPYLREYPAVHSVQVRVCVPAPAAACHVPLLTPAARGLPPVAPHAGAAGLQPDRVGLAPPAGGCQAHNQHGPQLL